MGQESTLASRSSYKKEKTYWPYTKPRHQAFALILGTFWSTSNVTSSTNASWSLSVSSRSNSGQQQKTRQHEPSGLWLRIIKLPSLEKDDVQADPTAISGKAEMAGRIKPRIRPPPPPRYYPRPVT